MNTDFANVVEAVGQAVDLAGVAIIVLGALAATVLFSVRSIRRRGDFHDGYRAYRQGLGRAILLGLEFLVAGDIIRTVAVAPTFTGVGVLALIVVVRTFLSFSLEVELENRLPWQPRPQQRP
ncbi:Uncharacterized membrane protein [Nonomuraea maritima]|uniref:Uncharacterized membrane protein n=1 Tax=Nonomuraea maritima TaxID=683260 RepID=A0A1G8WIL9_9ACTN|nr:DUF1622 domain-containing protein [Nonomuraea maritima]SDJ77505.1 Uncharacterized membrane protein [Nonomuraea maritima]